MTTKRSAWKLASRLHVPEALLLILAGCLALPAQFRGAPTEAVLYSFKGPSRGADPSSGVIRDSTGNLYGTTSNGGAWGKGVIYRVDPAGNQTVLHSFTGGADGSAPYGGVLGDGAGNLYGTASEGGAPASSAGVVYKLDATGHETVLYTFSGGADGSTPMAGVIRDAAGNLYGTTLYGGGSQRGTVFKLDAAGNETVLYSFTGGADGAYPLSGVVGDSAGNLYGTTNGGGIANSAACTQIGSGCGVLYKIDSSRHETVLYSFTGGTDGGNPQAGVIRDSAGNLYGTTRTGGTTSPTCLFGCCFTGCGVVFRVEVTGHETVLYSFTGGTGDGGSPSGVVRDAAGNLYATSQVNSYTDTGVVFRLSPAGQFTALHRFLDSNILDGAYPQAGVIGDGAGNLYGTAAGGFTPSGPRTPACRNGCGVVFKLDSTGHETVVYRFPAEPENPVGGLIRDASGNLYGTTASGGTSASGVVFKLDQAGNQTVLHNFTGSDGAMPLSNLISDSAGNLYGTTYQGGSNGWGAAFKVNGAGQEVWVASLPAGGGEGGNPVGGLVLDPTTGNVYGTAYQNGANFKGVLFMAGPNGGFGLVYTFIDNLNGNADGAYPVGGLTRDAAGNIYGTTSQGGTADLGVVFKLDTTGHETVLHNFTGPDGESPLAGLIADAAGNIYGTTSKGGSAGGGVVFKLDPAGNYTLLYSFTGADGAFPFGSLIADPAGNLYGTAAGSTTACAGVVFKIDPAGNETMLYCFTGGADGSTPTGSLALDAAGNLYGTTLSGGSANAGVVYMLKP